MSQVKKLSVATVFGKIKISDLVEKKTFPVMTVVGSAVAIKKGISAYGEFVSLQGRFRATNPVTGEVSEAAVLFLPDVALLPVQTQLAQPDCKGVDFAIRVGVKYVAEDEGHKAGGSVYEYWFEPLLEMGQDDPIARIEARLKGQELAKLAAPASDPKPENAAPVNGGKKK